MKASISAWLTIVPVGLFGFAMNSSRVRGVIAAAMAGRSCAKLGSSTSTVFAPISVAISV